MTSGFSSKRLQNIDAYLQRIVGIKQVAGVSASLIRHGEEAYCKSFGMQDIENHIPMNNDSLYRIFSMTKTFTVVAAMTLYEKGLFKLSDPISEFLPAFAAMQVVQHDERGVMMRPVPARTPITFEHLFTMTSGIPYPGPDSYSARIFAKEVKEIREVNKNDAIGTAEIVDAVAQVPLCFHPGEFWMYGFSHDVLGRIIEVISGRSLGAYMAEAIFEPLGLLDTDFFVEPEKRPRLAKAYTHTKTGLVEKQDLDPVPESAPLFESGGGGLISTLHDVGKYALMLLGGGALNGERILSRKTIDLIRCNHCIPSQQEARFGFPAMAGYGYGLGVRTLLDKTTAGLNGSLGEWAWDGMLGTWYCVDPEEDLVAVFLIQRYPGASEDLA
ncbi:MAG: beta-lactamase family protein, partial [Spirochaetaceae bacterium]|nr:beta-lactamase family protein [Spirochaetaceae bacterium]